MSEQPTAGADLEFDLADRMRKGLRIADMGVAEMADYLGVARTSVGNWINGRVRPGTQTLRLWSLRCGVPYEWLVEGECAVRDLNPEPAGSVLLETIEAGLDGYAVILPFVPRRRSADRNRPVRCTYSQSNALFHGHLAVAR